MRIIQHSTLPLNALSIILYTSLTWCTVCELNVEPSSPRIVVRHTVVRKVAVRDNVSPTRVIDHHTRCIWTVTDIDVRHVDTLTQIEVQCYFEHANALIHEVLTGAVTNCCTVEERNAVEGYVCYVHKSQTSSVSLGAVHRGVSTREGQKTKVLEEWNRFSEEMCTFRKNIIGVTMVWLLKDPGEVPARRQWTVGCETARTVFSSGWVDVDGVDILHTRNCRRESGDQD